MTREGVEETVDIKVNFDTLKEGKLVHCLAASSRIGDLQRKPETVESKKEVVELAKKYTLASKYTSYICTEPRETATEVIFSSR